MVFETKGKGKKDAVESVNERNSLWTSKQCKVWKNPNGFFLENL